MSAVGPAKKILLVEDDNDLAAVYSTRLSSEGFETRRVSDGEHALITAMDYQPDLVLLDLMMPALGGFDVLDILRNTPETSKVKIIILTARGGEQDKLRAHKLGADAYLVKSQVVIADVIAAIKKLLENHDPSKKQLAPA
jgi:DNA-binding response OmpR family regulator